MTDDIQLPEAIELDYTAKAGSPLEDGVKKAEHEEIIAALKSVQDPE